MDMKSILSITGGVNVEPETSTSVVLKKAQGNAAMREIIERLETATNGASRLLVEQASFDPEIKEILETEPTARGVKLGEFEIVDRVLPTKSGKTKSVYDIMDPHGVILVEKLYLYEAALIITRCLNRGEKFNSPKIQNVFKLEEAYARNRNDAIQFRSRVVEQLKRKNENQASIFEARFDRSRTEALKIQEELRKLADLL
jgi:hypothetical protein